MQYLQAVWTGTTICKQSSNMASNERGPKEVSSHDLPYHMCHEVAQLE